MRKFYLSIAAIILIPIILMGCGLTNYGTTSNDKLSKVSLSNSDHIGEMNTDFFVVYEDEETLDAFQKIFENAVKLEGIVDMSAPDVDIEVVYENNQIAEFHLWLGEMDEQSTLMNMEDTHTIYAISEDGTNQLIAFLQE